MAEFTFDLQRFDDEEPTVQEVGTATDLTTAIANGGSIKLTANITDLNAKLEISTNVTLDLNGFTLSRTDSDESESITEKNVISVALGGNLTIMDSRAGGTITSTGETISNSGTLTIKSGTIAGLCAVTNAGTLTIDGGTIKMADGVADEIEG